MESLVFYREDLHNVRGSIEHKKDPRYSLSGVFCISQIKAEQNPFTTETLRARSFPLFFSVALCLSGSKNVQPIADQYTIWGLYGKNFRI
jgi:hypothetical protein